MVPQTNYRIYLGLASGKYFNCEKAISICRSLNDASELCIGSWESRKYYLFLHRKNIPGWDNNSFQEITTTRTLPTSFSDFEKDELQNIDPQRN
jgi:hypothetical protein